MLNKNNFLNKKALYEASEKVCRYCEIEFEEFPEGKLTDEYKIDVICTRCDLMIDDSGRVDTNDMIMYSNEAQIAFDYMYDVAVERFM